MSTDGKLIDPLKAATTEDLDSKSFEDVRHIGRLLRYRNSFMNKLESYLMFLAD